MLTIVILVTDGSGKNIANPHTGKEFHPDTKTTDTFVERLTVISMKDVEESDNQIKQAGITSEWVASQPGDNRISIDDLLESFTQ